MSGDDWLCMELDLDVIIYFGVDVWNNVLFSWMKIGNLEGYEDLGLEIVLMDVIFCLYCKCFFVGCIILGGSINDF